MSFSRKLARRKTRLAANGTPYSARTVADASARRPTRSGDYQKISVINVSAFWKNNMLGGLGIGLRFVEEPNKGTSFCRILQSQLDVYDAHEATPDFIIEQLRRLGTDGAELSNEATMVAITNIYWLQERGHIEKDEYNGVIFAYTVEGTTTLIVGEENPLVIDLAKAARDGIDVTEIAKAGPLASGAAVRAVLDHARTLHPPPTATRSR